MEVNGSQQLAESSGVGFAWGSRSNFHWLPWNTMEDCSCFLFEYLGRLVLDAFISDVQGLVVNRWYDGVRWCLGACIPRLYGEGSCMLDRLVSWRGSSYDSDLHWDISNTFGACRSLSIVRSVVPSRGKNTCLWGVDVTFRVRSTTRTLVPWIYCFLAYCRVSRWMSIHERVARIVLSLCRLCPRIRLNWLKLVLP